jgi:hypothetical protein
LAITTVINAMKGSCGEIPLTVATLHTYSSLGGEYHKRKR